MEFSALGAVNLAIILVCLLTIWLANNRMQQKTKKTMAKIDTLLGDENETKATGGTEPAE